MSKAGVVQLPYSLCDSDKEDLRDMARTFLNLRLQSIAFSSNSDAVFDDALTLQDLLGEINVLEIRSIFWYCQDPDMLNRDPPLDSQPPASDRIRGGSVH